MLVLVYAYCWVLRVSAMLELRNARGGVGATLKRSSMLDMAELFDDQAMRPGSL